jgi:hypothetical protein
MQRVNILAQTATTPLPATTSPRWVPIKENWTWIVGTLTVAALAAGLAYMGSRKK